MSKKTIEDQFANEKHIFLEVPDKRYPHIKVPVVSFIWPDGQRFRRRQDPKDAITVRDMIRTSIKLGTWQEVRKKLTEPERIEHHYTIRQFCDVYLEDYCKVQRNRLGFKKQQLNHIKRLIGEVKLGSFTKADAMDFNMKRSKEDVALSTVNRGLAVLKNMLQFAEDRGLIRRNPMKKFKLHRERERDRKIMKPDEVRRLVEAAIAIDPVAGAYFGLLGETGLRREEGLGLEWTSVDLIDEQPHLTVEGEKSKSGKARKVPLSDYAVRLLESLPRVIGVAESRFVFVRLNTMRHLQRTPAYAVLKKAKAEAGISKTRGFHDFRHYRATEWLRNGVNIKTVKVWLGHSHIKTTERYLHHLEDQANEQFREAERRETERLERGRRNGEKRETSGGSRESA